MDSPTNPEQIDEHLSAELEKQLAEMTKQFDQQVKDLGSKYGLKLVTEVSFAIETE